MALFKSKGVGFYNPIL